ncbi:hypothetical protein ACI0X9_003297 [Cronobacter turicensis]
MKLKLFYYFNKHISIAKISALSSAFYKIFVLMPSVFFFVALVALSYSANGFGNLVTDYIENVGYNPADQTYRVCLDEPVSPTIHRENNHGKLRKEVEPVLQRPPVISEDCKRYGWISSAQKSSLITSSFKNMYASFLVLYLGIWFFIKVFTMRF